MRIDSFLIASFLLLAASTASAGEYKIGALDINNPWARATRPGAAIAGGYMNITNKGTMPDRLISGVSNVSTSIEIRPVKSGLEIKPGETVELKPGSSYLMFVGLKKPFNRGDHIKTTLVFQNAGKIDVDFNVLAMGAAHSHGTTAPH